ncbi:MAG: ABC-2 family transporter protein [Candidatus Pacebacteria bacterium]|nr:ABC-2 family transporter protein [Candidatus Paceibacterota bacterium]
MVLRGDNLITRYIKFWFLFAKYEVLKQFSSMFSVVFFFFGKSVRFFSFLLLLIVLQQHTKAMAGFTLEQVIIFFFTFNYIDLISQIFLRGVYMLSGKVRSGEFDFYLTQPMNLLFRTMAGNPDFNDLLLFIPLVLFSLWYTFTFIPTITLWSFILYLIFLIHGLLISLSFHIFVVCLGIVTTEIDNTIMVYRDISQMGRFPLEIYREPLRGFMTFVLPVGIMISVPSKALMGLASPMLLLFSLFITWLFFFFALRTWNSSLKMYTSASS